jgi:hypothetical protein
MNKIEEIILKQSNDSKQDVENVFLKEWIESYPSEKLILEDRILLTRDILYKSLKTVGFSREEKGFKILKHENKTFLIKVFSNLPDGVDLSKLEGLVISNKNKLTNFEKHLYLIKKLDSFNEVEFSNIVNYNRTDSRDTDPRYLGGKIKAIICVFEVERTYSTENEHKSITCLLSPIMDEKSPPLFGLNNEQFCLFNPKPSNSSKRESQSSLTDINSEIAKISNGLLQSTELAKSKIKSYVFGRQ